MGPRRGQGVQRIHRSHVWIHDSVASSLLDLRSSKRPAAPQEVPGSWRFRANHPEMVFACRADGNPWSSSGYEPGESTPSHRSRDRLVRDGCGAPFSTACEELSGASSRYPRHPYDALVRALLGDVPLERARHLGLGRNRNPALGLLCLHIAAGPKDRPLANCLRLA